MEITKTLTVSQKKTSIITSWVVMKMADRSHNVSSYSHFFLKYLTNAGMLSGLRQFVFDFIPRKGGPELRRKL